MRLLGATALSLLFSSLAIAGGTNGAMLCLHQSGVFHVAPSSEAEHRAPRGKADISGEGCDRGAGHACDWCLDVAIEALDPGLILSGDTNKPLLAAPATGTSSPSRKWRLPKRIHSAPPLSPDPPARPQALIVVRKTVLLL